MPLEKEDLSEDELNIKWKRVKSLTIGQHTREEQIVQQVSLYSSQRIRA